MFVAPLRVTLSPKYFICYFVKTTFFQIFQFLLSPPALTFIQTRKKLVRAECVRQRNEVAIKLGIISLSLRAVCSISKKELS